ncbi:universal stress protein [Salinadaptatus halalkaliphilus]|uniref:Universal stress protein n=1 Tax=Salinadaptatus halalkaliphilus TaxID=2419781 RepID=A0A4S3TIQ9_9EURY|nr:universal stress protein [Salinadaptatus halalkaliphilus]THE63842.1 universal stress protein [Salinadaptatus halalkaliphilus]
MYSVLIPLDEDKQRADEQVDTLLSLPGDADELSVTLLHVVEEIDTVPDEAGATVIEDINESLPELRGTPDAVEQTTRRLEDAGVETDFQRMVGDAADGILHIARENDVDAIILGSRKRSPVGKAVFGSVSQEVILETERTVMVAH